jgi:hypothetical protein
MTMTETPQADNTTKLTPKELCDQCKELKQNSVYWGQVNEYTRHLIECYIAGKKSKKGQKVSPIGIPKLLEMAGRDISRADRADKKILREMEAAQAFAEKYGDAIEAALCMYENKFWDELVNDTYKRIIEAAKDGEIWALEHKYREQAQRKLCLMLGELLEAEEAAEESKKISDES